MRTDPTRLRQILLNLAGNAVKFTEQGRVEITVAACREADASLLHIDIRDTGMGMTPEQSEFLFAPFTAGRHQRDSPLRRHRIRTGNLSASGSLDERQHHVRGKSPGVGSRFGITVPLRPVLGTTWTAALEPIKSAEPTPTLVPGGLRGRILLAEDGPDNQLLIGFYLRKAGFELDVAKNGRVALEMLDKATDALHVRRFVDRYPNAGNGRPHPDANTAQRGCTIPIIALRPTPWKKTGRNASMQAATTILRSPSTKSNC